MAYENILIVDDDLEIRMVVASILEKENMHITSLEDGEKVIPSLQSKNYDLVILDLMLKQQDGFDILKKIRRTWVTLPVIIISARDEVENIHTGLALDADDYLIKPFLEVELVARVKRHLRRKKEYSHQKLQEIIPPGSRLIQGDLVLDRGSCVLCKRNEFIPLAARLYKILEFFMEHSGQVLSAEQIYTHCWADNYVDENTIRVYIGKLRKIIEDNPRKPEILKTIVGLGYRFECMNNKKIEIK